MIDPFIEFCDRKNLARSTVAKHIKTYLQIFFQLKKINI